MFASGDAGSTSCLSLTVDGDLDEPLLAHNEVALRGTAEASSGIASVTLRIGAREWIAALDPEGPATRFEVVVDSSTWAAGERPFELVAVDGDGVHRCLAGVVDVLPYRSPPLGQEEVVAALASGAAAMWYEVPELAGGTVWDEHAEIRGWATSGEGIAAVLVTIDDRLRVPAVHGLARPDLRAGFGDEVAAGCGFALRLDPSELPVGRHVVTIVAVDGAGTSIGVAGTVDRVDRTPARIVSASAATPPVDHLASGERFVPELHLQTSLAPEHHARYRWAAPLVAGSRVLDVGCGVGWGTALLAERAASATGVDRSTLAVAESRRRHDAAADFLVGDMLDLPFEDASFDVVASFEAIEHVAEPGRALDEMRRVLRPDGLLLVSSPNRGVFPAGNPFHLRELTAAEFTSALSARFPNVAVLRQQTYVASLLGSDATLELDDPSRPLEARAFKLVGGAPGTELYSVAAASDGPLPDLSACLALGGEFDREEHLRMLEPWEDRTRRVEIELARARVAARAAARRIANLERELRRQGTRR